MNTSGVQILLFFAFLTIASLSVEAYDPDPLQDFCIAVNDTEAAGNQLCLFE